MLLIPECSADVCLWNMRNICLSAFRPSFLPDPNDGSLYVLGDKHKQGLMVSILSASVTLCYLCWCVMRDFFFLCRNFPSLFQSWFSRLPAEAQTASCIQVNTWVKILQLTKSRPADLHAVYTGALHFKIGTRCYDLPLNNTPEVFFSSPSKSCIWANRHMILVWLTVA